MYNCYTSYMSNERIQHKDAFKIPVSLRVYTWNGYSDHYRDLAPDANLLDWYHRQLKITKSHKFRFAKEYLRKLRALREQGVLVKYVDDIRLRLQYGDVFLLCFETPKKFCHRHILAWYLRKYFDLDISEY